MGIRIRILVLAPRFQVQKKHDRIRKGLLQAILARQYDSSRYCRKTRTRGYVDRRQRGSPPLTNNHWHVARVIILFHAETKRKLSQGIVYGRAFQVHDSTALSYLKNRECILGGYITTLSTFCTQAGNEDISTIIFIATSKNEQWLGEAPLHTIAAQIYECSGPSGHNVEYLLRLADFMHRYLPEAHDEHLFTLELLVRSRIKEENTCLRLLMGDRNFNIDLDDDDEIDVSDEDDSDDWDDNEGANNIRENTFQFSLRIPNKTLRCLKM
ncbi:putative glutathione-specific gamma-glutamylcyclotransferase 2 isoform X4 [Ptiloglossa arizonensis]|uniref:putative glutathione-specific gamma-glutamylcyclotransferase 2 isoform X4 n=1 Tax=Ptiloglossa arizonensis TaxID=3350558 RepID=UPI003FA0B4B3